MDRWTLLNSVPRCIWPEPPAGLSLALQTLWWDAKGDWKHAHECAQQDEGRPGHRCTPTCTARRAICPTRGYWYNRAGRTPATGTLDAEWEALARELLAA